MSRRKKCVFATLTTLCFFVGLELLLWLIGIEPVVRRDDPYVGFTSNLPVYTETEQSGGDPQMVTAENKRPWFNVQQFPKQKPKDAFRIVCVGGSTTYGRPYDDATSFCGWLREFLPAADASRDWEVINAGGISYASYRVVLVVEELLRYEPDLVIVYSGHNEFLERRTYGEILETPRPLRELILWLNRTRTFAAVEAMAGRSNTTSRPENESKTILPSEVDAILDHTIGPETYSRNDHWRDDVLDHYRFNLDRLVDIVQSTDCGILFVTPASNLKDCTPFKSEHSSNLSVADREQFAELFDRATDAYESGRFEQALQMSDDAMQIDDRYADLHFLRGQILLMLERHSAAKRAFISARDEDVCPLRSLTEANQILRDTAEKRGVALIDFESLVNDRTPNEIPGEELFLDHVHPTIEVHRSLALKILDHLIATQVLKTGRSWNNAAIARITQQVEESIDRAAHADALCKLSQVLGWAGKTEEADRLGLRAVALDPDNARARFHAGNALFRQFDLEGAAEQYEASIRLDPDMAESHYALGRVRAEQNRIEEAQRHFEQSLTLEPNSSQAHYEIGLLYDREAKSADAARHYERATAINPEDFRSLNNLALLRAREDRTGEAIRLLERAVAANPRFIHGHLNLSMMYAIAGRRNEGIEHYHEAIRLEPRLSDRTDKVRELLELDDEL